MSIYSDYIKSTRENSMMLWWPKVKDLNIPMPKTEMIDCTQYERQFWSMLDGNAEIPLSEEIDKVITDIFGYPCFIRGDLTSGKHNFLHTCYLVDDSDKDSDYYQDHRLKYIKFHVYNLVEQSILGPEVMPNAFFIREYINLEHKFEAFHGLPISKERRIFIQDDAIQCSHPYWPISSIEFYTGTPPVNWEELLEEQNQEDEYDSLTLEAFCHILSRTLEGYWSVDFAKSIDGIWYFIDCARGVDSYHLPDCSNSTRH